MSDQEDALSPSELRDFRLLMGWSQRRMAQEFKVSAGAVAQWENGQRRIPGPVKVLVEIYSHRLGMLDIEMTKGGLKSDWASRTLRSAGLATKSLARIGGASLRTLFAGHARALEIKEATEQRIAEELAHRLGELKGLLLKVGQMLSYIDLSFSESFKEKLQCLQQDVPPMDYRVLRASVRHSLGQDPQKLFAFFDEHAFAAASIGQVHRCRLKSGEEAVLKIQYPKIRDAIESDFQNLKVLDLLFSSILKNHERDIIWSELRETIVQECDYGQEAAHQRAFKQRFADDEHVIIPEVYDDFCARTVLCSEFIDGRSLESFAKRASQERRNEVAETIHRFSFESIYKYGVFNADPHPGNYIIPRQSDGSQVAFIDFGCVKTFSEQHTRLWRQFALAVVQGTRTKVDALFVEMGFVPDPDRFDFDYNYEMSRALFRPWIKDEAFRFTHAYTRDLWRRQFRDNPNMLRTKLPKEWVFANRIQFGLCSVLASLDAEANWHRAYINIVDG